jgi:hypothetical protein
MTTPLALSVSEECNSRPATIVMSTVQNREGPHWTSISSRSTEPVQNVYSHRTNTEHNAVHQPRDKWLYSYGAMRR